MKNLSSKYSELTDSVTLAITAKAKQLKADGADVIFFSVGEPDFITPEHIREAAEKAMDEGKTGYTAASGLPELKEAVIRKFERDNGIIYEKNNIIISNGAKHALFNSLQAVTDPGDEVILGSPYWVSYPELIKMAGGKPVVVPTDESGFFKLNRNNISPAVTEKTKAIILNSPGNPTGSIYSEEELKQIGQLAAEHDLYIISDEIYEKLIYEGIHISIASLSDELKERTIVINGLSKSYAMTGWRIGYSAANAEITGMIQKLQSHSTSNPNTIAQHAAVYALTSDEVFLDGMRTEFRRRRDLMSDLIERLPDVSCYIPQGAFYIWMNVKKLVGKEISGHYINNSMRLSEVFLEKLKVAVVPGEAFGKSGYIRLSFAASIPKIQEGIGRIAELLNESL